MTTPTSTALVVIDDAVLAKINDARLLLAEAKTIQDAKHIADVAEAARVYAKRVESSIETVNYAAEIKISAERLLGEMLAKTPDAKTGPKQLGAAQEPNSPPTLKAIGIKKKLSARAQKLAAIPIEKVHEAIEEQKAEGVEITTTGTLKRIDPEAKTITVEVETIDPEPMVFKSVKRIDPEPKPKTITVTVEASLPREGVVQAKRAMSLLMRIEKDDKLRFDGFKHVHAQIEIIYPRLKNYNHKKGFDEEALSALKRIWKLAKPADQTEFLRWLKTSACAGQESLPIKGDQP
jgi:hypothetical protein